MIRGGIGAIQSHSYPTCNSFMASQTGLSALTGESRPKSGLYNSNWSRQSDSRSNCRGSGHDTFEGQITLGGPANDKVRFTNPRSSAGLIDSDCQAGLVS